VNTDRPDRSNLPALDRLGEQLVAAESELEPSPSRLPALAIALGAAAVLVGLSFTPPGRVVAGEVGELVGFGDEPTVPQRAANEGDAVVVGTGETPGGQPVELVASTLNPFRCPGEEPGARSCEVYEDPSKTELCFNLDLVAPAKGGLGVCITTEGLYRTVETEGFGPVSASSHSSVEGADLVVDGAMRSDAQDVTVTYRDAAGSVQELPVIHGQLPPDLAAEIGSRWTAGGFVAFVPEGAIAPSENPAQVVDYRQVAELIASIEISTYDAEGNITADTTIDDPERLATMLSYSPPARLADAFDAREKALKECQDEGEHRVTAVPVDPHDPIGSLEESIDPELERCVAARMSETP
jgi:hypothetical protein